MTLRRVTLEHFKNTIVLTLVLVQASLGKRKWGRVGVKKVFGKIPPILLQISLSPPTRCIFTTSVIFQYWVDR